MRISDWSSDVCSSDLKLKAQYPGTPVAAHPECPAHIVDHADYVGSTSGILDFANNMEGDTLIVATEPHIIHQMEKAMPQKTFIGAPGADGNCNCNICPTRTSVGSGKRVEGRVELGGRR